jgi:branched-chain amino acid transport system ATP-binding protein
MKASSLSVSGLNAGYGQTVILEDIVFDIAPGTCTAILGRNGMGKTTLMASLMGLTQRHSGSITLDGTDIAKLQTWQRVHLGISYVPQTRDVFPTLTVEENLSVGLKARPRSALDEAYTLFPRLAERRNNMGRQLSGGEQQMLSTARSLLGQPSILLLDEPLEGLAPVISHELMSGLSELKVQGHMTIILVEQRVASALELADQVIVLERGRLAWEGSVGTWEKDPDLTDRYLGVTDGRN